MRGSLNYHWHFVWDLVRREMRGRYSGSALGLFWTVVSPALTILIFVMVFSRIMAAKLGLGGSIREYVVYLCCGIIAWSAFQEAIQRAVTVFGDHAGLIKRVFFHKEILVVQIIISTTLNLCIAYGLFMIAMIVLKHPPSYPALLLPVVVLLQALFTFGLALLVATANVFLRDLSHGLGPLLHLWFWLTPIVYPASIIPPSLRWLMRLNPMTHLLNIYRSLLLHAALPGGRQLLCFTCLALLSVAVGVRVYSRLSSDIADEV